MNGGCIVWSFIGGKSDPENLVGNFVIRAMENTSRELRYGQRLYNYLHTIRPDLARKIVGGPIDIFYANDNDPRFEKFFQFLMENW
jgi:hypothetical protein